MDGIVLTTWCFLRLKSEYCGLGWGWTSGSCWAHAAVSSLADRHKILRSAEWPDIEYSVQVLVFIPNYPFYSKRDGILNLNSMEVLKPARLLSLHFDLWLWDIYFPFVKIWPSHFVTIVSFFYPWLYSYINLILFDSSTLRLKHNWVKF